MFQKQDHVPQIERFYDISHSIRNFEDPLLYNENENVRRLKNISQLACKELHQMRQSNTQFSKNIYKKVISRDNEYSFPVGPRKWLQWDIQTQFNFQETKKTRKEEQTFQRQKKSFKHGDTATESIIQRHEQNSTRLTFADINLVDSLAFDLKCKDKEFYEILKSNRDEGNQMHVVGDFSQIQSVHQKINAIHHQPVEENQYFSQLSEICLFDCDKEINFWKKKQDQSTMKDQSQIYSLCATLNNFQVSIWNVFDIAAKNIQHKDITMFSQIKNKQLTKMETEKKQKNLQQKYNELKKKLEIKKQSQTKIKNQRIQMAPVTAMTQTILPLEEKSFDDYFKQDAKNVFDRLQELNKIRDKIIVAQKDENFGVLSTNIAHEISKQLFKLLLLLLKGQNFPQCSKMLSASSKNSLEKEILQLVYFRSNEFKVSQINGTSKINILSKYLQQRNKNESFYETYLAKNSKK